MSDAIESAVVNEGDTMPPHVRARHDLSRRLMAALEGQSLEVALDCLISVYVPLLFAAGLQGRGERMVALAIEGFEALAKQQGVAVADLVTLQHGQVH
jgi:hypothetical protein